MHASSWAMVIVVLVLVSQAGLGHLAPSQADLEAFPQEGETETCGGIAPVQTKCSTGQHLYALEILHGVVVGQPGIAESHVYSGVAESSLFSLPSFAVPGIDPVVVLTCAVYKGHSLGCGTVGELGISASDAVARLRDRPFGHTCDSLRLDGVSTPVLAPGAEIVVPSVGWLAQSGPHTLTVLADSTDRLDEARELNNDRALTFTVPGPLASTPNFVPPAPVSSKPDLIVKRLEMALDVSELPNVDPGETVTFNAVVKNVGTAPAALSETFFWLDGTSSLGADLAEGGKGLWLCQVQHT